MHLSRPCCALSLPLLGALAVHCASNAAPVPPPTTAASPASATTATPAASSGPRAETPPITPKRPVVDEYWGQKVVDEYRWLENGNDPAVKAWSDEQNAYAHRFLDAVPRYADIRARMATLIGHKSPDYTKLAERKGVVFAIKDEPPKQQPFLVVQRSLEKPDEGARVLVDPNAIDGSGKTAIDWYVPSLDGKLVAVSLSEGGTENGSVHVFDVATGKEKGDVIAHVQGGTAGGSLAWNGDGSGFYYTRYPRPGERPPEDLDFYQQIWLHKLGAKPASDTYSLGKDFPRIAEVKLETSDDGRYVLAEVANGDGGEFAYYVLGPGAAWTKFADYKDKVVHAKLGRDGRIYLVSHQGAPRGKVLRTSAQRPSVASAEVVVPESNVVVDDIEVTKTRLWVKSLVGGPSQLASVPLDGPHGTAQPSMVPILPVSQVSEIVRMEGDRVLVRNESFVSPPAWYELAPDASAPKKTGMAVTSPADFSDTEVTVQTCTSKDGTRVPISIMRQKTAPKPGPTVLYGYGGFALSQEPRFRAQWRAWIEQGGTYAVANIRGGSEMGETWHDQGKVTSKQNVFDDFAACADLLLRGYATKDKLAIMGRSNGGLLMGAELTQHPEMFRAVVSGVGIYDMLRVELAPNGAFNVTEYGTVKDKAQFEALSAYSPLHHVKDGVAYPAVLLMTGANDPRVDPYHSRKMVARLQAATSSGLPVLLRTSGGTGHGLSMPLGEAIAEQTDMFAFLFEELGVRYAKIE